MVGKIAKNKDPEVTLSEKLFAEFPEAIAEERVPTDSELKKKIRELHEEGDREDDVKSLFAYLKDRPKVLTLRQKVAKWSSGAVFVFVLGVTGFGAWWFLYGAESIDDTFIVCRIGTVEYRGEACLVEDTSNEETPAPRPPSVQPGETDVTPPAPERDDTTMQDDEADR